MKVCAKMFQSCLSNVAIQPASSGQGMQAQLMARTYWCISRQRVWGVPIPVFYHADTRTPLITRYAPFRTELVLIIRCLVKLAIHIMYSYTLHSMLDPLCNHIINSSLCSVVSNRMAPQPVLI